MSEWKIESVVPLIPVQVSYFDVDGKHTILVHVDVQGKKVQADPHLPIDFEEQVLKALIRPLPPAKVPEGAMAQFKQAQGMKPPQEAMDSVGKIMEKDERK